MPNKYLKAMFVGGGLKRVRYFSYVLLAIVLFVVALILFLKEKPGTLKVDNNAFAVTDTAVITTIKIGDGKNIILLDRSGGSWKVNQLFNAKPIAMKALLSLLMRFEVNAPVSNSMKPAVLKSFKKEAITIMVESSGKLIRAYRITENDSLKVGSFMMLKDDNDPYLVHVAGYNGRLSKLFPCDMQFWRDKVIFRYRPQDVLSIQVDYPAKPQASFTYQFLGPNDIEIKSTKEKSAIKISKDVARIYLMNFASVPYETQLRYRVNDIYDSLYHQKPYCEIRITNASNQVNKLRTYQIPVSGQKGRFDIYRMYAVHQNDTVPIIIRYADFDPIMKEYSDFLVQ